MSKKAMDVVTRKITLSGLKDVMFDRYPGDNKTELMPEQKLYCAEDGKTLVLPTANLFSFLGAENTTSCAKKFGAKGWRNIASGFLSFLSIDPDPIPFTKNGKPIQFDGFDKDVYVREDVARLKGGIPNPKKRPVIKLPWELSFDLTIFRNEYFQEELLQGYIERGGLVIGLGSYRPVFGKFQITEWK